MGVIKRQGLKQSIVNYAGVGVAALATVFVYPLDRETYGLANFLLGTSLFLLPFISCGMHMMTLRYFPKFQNEENGHQGLFGFISLVTLTGWFIFSGLFLLLEPLILKHLISGEDIGLFKRYIRMLLPITFFHVFVQLYLYYCSVFKRIVWPAIFQNFIKLALPVLLLLYYFEYISLDIFVWGIVVNFAIALVANLIYIYSLGQLHLRINTVFFEKKFIKEILNYVSYGMLLSMGSALALRIDAFMIPALIDFENNGIYGVSMFIGSAIAIPANALIQIGAPIISETFAKKDFKHLKFLYQESSLNLLLIGVYFFVGVSVCVEDLFLLMPNHELMKSGVVVVLIIGFSKVIDMATGLNNQIINLSQYFRFGLYAILTMGILNVIFNLWLIPIYGIWGAALATLSSIIIYNLIKLVFIYAKWRIQPFSVNMLFILLTGVLIIGLVYNIPLYGGASLRILQKAILVSLIYFSIIYYFKFSKEFNSMLEGIIENLKKSF